MPVDLVVLDCDGVLVDSEPIANRVLTAMLGEVGLPLPTDEVMRTFVGRTMAACVAIVEGRLGRPLPEDFVARYVARRDAAFRRELRAVPGIVEALDAVAAPTCVASNGPHAKMRLTLGLVGLLDRFDGRLFSAEDVARGKPHPDLYLHVAARMGAAPARCVVVEDSAAGVIGARAAGMRVLGYAGAEHADAGALATAGAVVFRAMRDLPGALASLS